MDEEVGFANELEVSVTNNISDGFTGPRSSGMRTERVGGGVVDCGQLAEENVVGCRPNGSKCCCRATRRMSQYIPGEIYISIDILPGERPLTGSSGGKR